MRAALLVPILLVACAAAVDPPAPIEEVEAVAREELGWIGSATGKDGGFEARIASRPAPLPLNESFELELELRDPFGAPIEGASPRVDAWMPDHGHGMFRQSTVAELGGGRYGVVGMLLHMPGHWELRVDLPAEGGAERATLAVTPGADPMNSELSPVELLAALQLANPGPPPADPTNRWSDDPKAALLGQAIFYDPGFSANGQVSCATCHDPAKALGDGRALASGLGLFHRHTPPLYNVAHQRWFFWDGRADTLWSQALQPLENPLEHGFSRLEVAHRIGAVETLRQVFEELFGPLPELSDKTRFPPAGRPVDGDPDHPHAVAWSTMSDSDKEAVNRLFVNVGKALAAYQRKLVSNDSAFDRYVRALESKSGERPEEFSPAAERGLALFVGRAGCVNCHHGPLFSDREFHDTLVPARDERGLVDSGRYGGVDALLRSPFIGTGPYSDDPDGETRLKIDHLLPSGHDRGRFRTPSLRNVAVTAPYMHQGQFQTLEAVLEHYSTLHRAREGRHPDPLMRPLNLDESEVADLIAFLESLTDDDVPDELVGIPDL